MNGLKIKLNFRDPNLEECFSLGKNFLRNLGVCDYNGIKSR
jgi:hypothetical protein